MNIQGKLIIIGGAVDKGSFTETDLDKSAPQNLNFFESLFADYLKSFTDYKIKKNCIEKDIWIY